MKFIDGGKGIIIPLEIKESIATTGLESNSFELSELQEVIGELMLLNAVRKIPNPEVSGGWMVVVIGITPGGARMATHFLIKSRRVVSPKPVPSSSTARL